MALLEKHRSSIYLSLAPILGEEEAQAMLAQFPARDLDEPITRDYFDRRLAETTAELRVEMRDLNTKTIMWLVGTMVALNATNTTLILALG